MLTLRRKIRMMIGKNKRMMIEAISKITVAILSKIAWKKCEN